MDSTPLLMNGKKIFGISPISDPRKRKYPLTDTTDLSGVAKRQVNVVRPISQVSNVIKLFYVGNL